MTIPFTQHLESAFPDVSTSKILIAVSGGLDSVVLTDLCVKSGLNISLAHCNFHLRGTESNGDEDFIVEWAENLDLEIFVADFDTRTYAAESKISIQMAARELRYRWFDELRNTFQFDYIFTAHHANDNLETVLINLVRGTGLDGLTGIPERKAYVLRPLLPFSRSEIEEYARQNALTWREDSSNLSVQYVRNQMRLEVIPKLMEMNPQLLESFGKSVQYLQQSAALVEDYIAALFDKIAKNEAFGYSFSVSKIQSLPHPRAVLYELFKPFGFTQWEDIYSLLEGQSGKVIYSKTHRLIKDRESLLLTILEENQEKCIRVEAGEKTVSIPPGRLVFKDVQQVAQKDEKVIFIDKEKLKFPVVLRKWKEGDFFYPSGMKGKKKLSKFFKDKKLSLPEKEACWLLCSEQQIVWVVGHRADERFTANEKSTSILKISYL